MPLSTPTTGGGDSLLEAGSGLSAVQSVPTQLAGQILVTNGSAAIVGTGTAFTGIAAQHVPYMSGIVVVDSAGGVYYIAGLTVVDDTHATITAVTLGASVGPTPAATFPGVTGTYNYYLLYSNAAGDGSTAIGINAAALGLSSTAYGQSATAIPNNLGNGEALAVGDFALAKGDYAVAIGPDTVADGDLASAFGEFVNAVGTAACALGSNFTNNTPASVGLGASALFVLATADRIEVKNPSGGPSDLVICSPNGTRWKITVDNAGVISAATA